MVTGLLVEDARGAPAAIRWCGRARFGSAATRKPTRLSSRVQAWRLTGPIHWLRRRTLCGGWTPQPRAAAAHCLRAAASVMFEQTAQPCSIWLPMFWRYPNGCDAARLSLAHARHSAGFAEARQPAQASAGRPAHSGGSVTTPLTQPSSAYAYGLSASEVRGATCGDSRAGAALHCSISACLQSRFQTRADVCTTHQGHANDVARPNIPAGFRRRAAHGTLPAPCAYSGLAGSLWRLSEQVPNDHESLVTMAHCCWGSNCPVFT